MGTNQTSIELAKTTDEGLFECLATAILREANPIYHSLVHPGVNPDGKTVKSPLDGICFVPGAEPSHMIAVHHTITALKDLENKWLHDPAKVKPRKGNQPTAPAGDLIKTAEIVIKERSRTPNLRATLVLTTNQEPGEALVREVEAVGRSYGLEIDIWSRSRLAHFLDNSATGQWLRHFYLGLNQELLSPELLQELSKKCLDANRPPDNSQAWISRALDSKLATNLLRDVVFLVAGSGSGKSVACYRNLSAHVEAGGFGLILPHYNIASAITLDQAVLMTLRQLHPSLASVSATALSFCTADRPLLLIVEDINRSGQSHFLIEKIAGWSNISADAKQHGLSFYRLICPIWPEVLSSLSDQTRQRIQQLTMTAGSFTADEGREAVLARASINNRKVSALTAQETSNKLGNDPLLIALHDVSKAANPHQVISEFAEGSISRAAAASKNNPPADYRLTLRALAAEMLTHRQMEPSWNETKNWAKLQGEFSHLLNDLSRQGELIRLTGPSDDQHLLFRHDRVRNWILADGAAELDRQSLLTDDIVADPYFSEVMGAALSLDHAKPDFLQRLATLNPLALFYALRTLEQNSSQLASILQSINGWLEKPLTHARSNLHLRWEALGLLAETDSPAVPDLVRKFPDRITSGEIARLRNGDLSGGIELCFHVRPGVGAPWRDIQIEHAKDRYGRALVRGMDTVLRKTDLSKSMRSGALRLAGLVADKSLGLAIEACWNLDNERNDILADYLWAAAECCADNPQRFLEPVCNAWASLPDKVPGDDHQSHRHELIEHEVRWAFQKWPPHAAIDYFLERAKQDDLRFPILRILDVLDNPKAVLFLVQQLAEVARRIEGSSGINLFLVMAPDEWRRAQENNRPMSKASRDLLLGVWQNKINDNHLREQAFKIWAANREATDIAVLRAADQTDYLADSILRELLIRGDQQAIPRMIEKVKEDDHGIWWQCGRHVWSHQLTDALDKFLERRGKRSKRTWNESFNGDWIIHDLIMRLAQSEAEQLLLKHWDHLKFAPDFVQTALYVSTPSLLEAAKRSLNDCPEPAKLLEHLSMVWGIRTTGHPGITQEAQIRALAPYLHFLSNLTIGELWETCNQHGWFALRRELLDALLQSPLKLWNRNMAFKELDEMAKSNRKYWIDHWLDEFLKTDVSWTEILITMKTWFDKHRSLEALELIANAIIYRGSREDVLMLTYEGMPEIAAEVVADAKFSVRRRSLK
jgi:hypothetical protein